MLKFDEISNACVKCGKCIPDCTIHIINTDEITSPRGFLDLIGAYTRGELKLDKNMKNIFNSCFLCTNCTQACPSNLRVDSAIEAVRYDIAYKFGISWYKKIIFYLLSHRKIMDFLARLGYVFQSCAFKIQGQNDDINIFDKDNKISKNFGMKARFSMPLIKKNRLLMSLSKKSFLNSNSNFIDNGGDKTIGFFVGCLSNYAYTSTANAVLKITKELKINIDLMKDQNCCGAPHYFTGDFKNVSKLAKKNIAYFEEKLKTLDAIIVPEATCSAMLNIDYIHLFHMIKEPQWEERAKNISSKIKLATKYFYDETKLLTILKNKNKNNILITYHDPCHARKMQGVFKEPRAFLKENFNLVELKNINTCCGFGGISMQSEYFDNSLKIAYKKIDDIEQSQAQIVSAECSACRMQISNALEAKNSNILFKNPLELIASIL